MTRVKSGLGFEYYHLNVCGVRDALDIVVGFYTFFTFDRAIHYRKYLSTHKQQQKTATTQKVET